MDSDQSVLSRILKSVSLITDTNDAVVSSSIRSHVLLCTSHATPIPRFLNSDVC